MLVQLFTLKFQTATERFDDREFQEFIKDKEVLAVQEHFFLKQTVPYLLLMVTYLPGTEQPTPPKKSEKWRETVTNEQMPLFNALRKWRAERARQDGCPVYIICTNDELAEMVTGCPDSLAGLSKIHGFGAGKAEKYGQEILTILARQPEQSPAPQVQQQTMFHETPSQSEPKK